MEEFKYMSTSATPSQLSSGERRALRTLAAAQQLLHPERPPAVVMSSVEAELAKYVREAYRPRTLSAW